MEERRDVVVKATAARAGAYSRGLEGGLSGPEQIEFYRMEAQRLTLEMAQFKSVATTMANVALCFAQMLVENGIHIGGEDRSVIIPREFSDRMTGQAITVTAHEGEDLIVRIRDRDRVGGLVGRED